MSPHNIADTNIVIALNLVRTLILVLGGIIAYFAYKAYQDTGARALGALSLGFAFVTLGSLIGGFLHIILHIDLTSAILADSIMTLIGFGTIVYSLYTD